MKRTRRERRSRPNALYIAPFTFNLALLPFPTLSPRAPMFRVPFGANLLGVLPFYGTTREGENRLRFASSLEPLSQRKGPSIRLDPIQSQSQEWRRYERYLCTANPLTMSAARRTDV